MTRTSRVPLTLLTVLGLWCGFALYARLTRPLLRATTAPEQVLKIEPPAPSPEFAMWASRYLRTEPWAVNAPYRHRDQNTFVYCREYLLRNDRRSVKLAPFAVVMADQAAAGKTERPLTLLAKSAQLDFSSGLEGQRLDVGRLDSGQLYGPVRIEGPDLLIVGGNFVVNESSKRIWSDDLVFFRYGPHRGRGRGVEIRLATDDDDDGLLSAKHIRTVRLREAVRMELIADSDDDEDEDEDEDEKDKRRAADDPDDKPDLEDIVRIQSAGHLEFDLETNIATFERDVVLRRQTSPDEADTLRCGVLTVQFRQPDESEPSEREGQDSGDDGESDGHLEPVQITAQGRVELRSEENELFATQLTDLTYLVDERVIELANTFTFPNGSGPPIQIRQKENVIETRRLTLVHNEDNKITSALCRGRGRITRLDSEDPSSEMTVTWQQELQLEPDPNENLQRLTLLGRAVVNQVGEQTALSAERIQLWFREAEDDDDKENTDENGESEVDVIPVRLVADTNVSITSPRMSGPTSLLTLDFETPPPGAQPATRERPRQRPGSSPSEEDELFDGNFSVSADEIHARVWYQPGQPTTAPEVQLRGNVAVTSTDSPDQPSMSLHGNFLHILEDGANSQTMKLTGSPARVRQTDRHIEGSSIYLDRSGNHAEVVGGGSMKFDVDKDLQGQPLEIPLPLRIAWTDGMSFDGRVAHLRGSVTGTLSDENTQEQHLSCRDMKVHFGEAISFTDGLAGGDANDLGKLLETIECLGGVEISSHRLSQGRTLEERHAWFRKLTVNQKTGDTHATGPGWITSWSPDNGDSRVLSPAVSARANASIEARRAGWTYTRIEFIGELQGDFKRRITTFRNNVEIVYGPVERLSEVIDPDAAAGGVLPRDAARMRCHELQVTEHEAGGQKSMELMGSGNAELEGHSYHAMADEIKFDEVKNLFILRALGNRSATIWRQERVGGSFNPVHAQRFEFSPSRRKLKASGVRSVRGSDG